MSSMFTRRPQLRHNQQGMVSIMTTMILMIVISLIVLGFAQIARRNQRETLDTQLSTQAFYAAETGVNDVRQLMQTAVNSGVTIPSKTSCSDVAGGFYSSLSATIDSSHNVSYSCVMVNAAPTTLRYSDVGPTSIIVPMTSSTGVNFNKITLSWQSKATGSVTAGCPTSTNNVFAPSTAASWTCGYGVLRFDLVPTSGSLSFNALQAGNMVDFAVPFSSGGTNTVPYAGGSGNTNNVSGVSCTNSGCSLTITGLSQNNYYMRISSIYRDVALQITSVDGSGNPVPTSGAQAVIDSTGRAQDVLRRIQVNVPVGPSSQNQLPDYAIQSTDSLCKRYAVMNGYYQSSMSGSGVTGTNRICQ